MNTPTEQEVENLAELIQDKMSFDWEACCGIAHWHLSQVAAKDERIRELEMVLQTVKEKGHLGEHRHWDETMRHGIGCPLCIDQRVAWLEVQSALKTKEAGK